MDISKINVPHQHSLTSAKLIELLKSGKPGEVLTDEYLTSACSKDVRKKAAGNLRTAIDFVTTNHGLVWGRIRGASAIKCLRHEEIGDVASSAARSVSRKCRNTVKQLNCVDMNAVSPADKAKYLTLMAQHGTLMQFASASTQKALAARNVQQPLALAEILSAFPK